MKILRKILKLKKIQNQKALMLPMKILQKQKNKKLWRLLYTVSINLITGVTIMKLHYKGKYDLNPDSLPHQPHKPNAVPFKEAKDTKTMAMICNIAAFLLLLIPLLIILFFRCGRNGLINLFWGGRSLSMLCLFPHEILHAVCFKEDVYLYTNFKQGMLFL